MSWKPDEILAIFDQCSASFTFPMLDNGYVYLAATRLSAYRSEAAWGLVIEVFGYSPRAGLPDTHIHTFASSLHNRDFEEKYKSRRAYENYLANNPHNESRFVFPVDMGNWQDPENSDDVAAAPTEVILRGQIVRLPSLQEFGQRGIKLEAAPSIRVFELCRFLAEVHRESVLCNSDERRISVLPEMNQILQLEEWNHPNLAENELPSQTETFRQLAQVLATGFQDAYRPSRPPNTHWKNWPDGGSL